EGDALDAGPGTLRDEEGQRLPVSVQGLDDRHDARAEVAFILVEKPKALDAVFELLLVQERVVANRQFFGQFFVLDVVVAIVEDFRHEGFLRDDENHRDAPGHRLSLHADVLEVSHLVDRADLLPDLLCGERLAFLQRDAAPDGRRLDPLVALEFDRLDQLSRFLRDANALAVGPDEPHPQQAPDPQYRGHSTGGPTSEYPKPYQCWAGTARASRVAKRHPSLSSPDTQAASGHSSKAWLKRRKKSKKFYRSPREK